MYLVQSRMCDFSSMDNQPSTLNLELRLLEVTLAAGQLAVLSAPVSAHMKAASLCARALPANIYFNLVPARSLVNP